MFIKEVGLGFKKAWTDCIEYTKDNPLNTFVYDLALKFFGLYVKTFYPPLGFIIFCSLWSFSFILDISLLYKVRENIKKFFTDLSGFISDINEKIKKSKFYQAIQLFSNWNDSENTSNKEQAITAVTKEMK